MSSAGHEPGGVVAELARLGIACRDADALPPRLVALAASHVRDTLGVALAAGGEWPDDPVTAVVRSWGGVERSGAVGRGGRYPAAHAALIGGTLAHAIDFDDTHLPSVLHPSASTVPAALACAEPAGAGGRTFLAAVAFGDEVCCRLGMAGYDRSLGNSVFFENGLHATAICGAVGAAGAAALVLGLDEDGVADAMSIATSMGSGLIEANRTGGMVKRVHCGWAAHAGVCAATLAEAGLTGAPTAIEGRFGFLRAFCGEAADLAAVTSELGQRWELDRLHVKPYPSNHFTHSGIDAALELRGRGIEPGHVESVEIGLPGAVLRTVAEPRDLKVRPPNGYAARFSGPYTFAAAMRGGGGLGLFLDDFADARIADPVALALAASVTCVRDERCDELFPECFPAVVTVHVAGKGTERVEILENRGGPARPLTAGEASTKFRACAGRVLDEATVATLDATLASIDELSDLEPLVSLLGVDENRRSP
jgi:2-methylcitrate dehydratase PrpD